MEQNSKNVKIFRKSHDDPRIRLVMGDRKVRLLKEEFRNGVKDREVRRGKD
ncbi:hypothetical protein Gohar_013293 [Gossypium harknessii]|uniref:Uncharacterized protein n=1 Tax=Gossypium harknessii TaxID=34285 RepID=A0A7J9GZK7_9ROSI|nr:hypothetical protein [Gossypium harknessii]